MPGMDGWSVLAALKADPALAAIPVIMMSIVNDKNMGFALGVSDYLNKPIDRDALVAALRKYQRGGVSSHVLVVDDDAVTREMLRRLVQGEGWTVSEAENGRVALERLAEGTPALILLDLMMPEMDGFQFVVECSGTKPGADPVAVITAKDLSAEDRARLNGTVEMILQKGAYSRDELLVEFINPLSRPTRRGDRLKNSKYIGFEGIAEPRSNPLHAERLLRESAPAMTDSFHGGTMATILLVEDNEMNRDMLSRRLERKGFDVVIAMDGKGFKMARQRSRI